MDETNVVDLLPLIAECVLRRAAEMRVYADRMSASLAATRTLRMPRAWCVS